MARGCEDHPSEIGVVATAGAARGERDLRLLTEECRRILAPKHASLRQLTEIEQSDVGALDGSHAHTIPFGHASLKEVAVATKVVAHAVVPFLGRGEANTGGAGAHRGGWLHSGVGVWLECLPIGVVVEDELGALEPGMFHPLEAATAVMVWLGASSLTVA